MLHFLCLLYSLCLLGGFVKFTVAREDMHARVRSLDYYEVVLLMMN